jgi:tight adherence protein B
VTPGPLMFALLIGLGVLLGFVAMWRMLAREDPVTQRLKQYGVDPDDLAGVDTGVSGAASKRRLSGLNRLLSAFGLGPSLATALAQADLPITAAEYVLLTVLLGIVGFVVGTLLLQVNFGVSMILGLLPVLLSILFLRRRQHRRQRQITEQIPELLSLLIGALRAGYGLSQALEIMADQLPMPMASEIRRVLRGIGLGLPIQRALSEMAVRVGTDEMDMVVTAINVQYETGGNLAQTLETIGVTVRDRLNMKREIRVLTSQQRLTGYILAFLPFILGFLLFIINPDYMRRLFEPGWIRIVPVVALTMEFFGFLIIRHIVNIEV